MSDERSMQDVEREIVDGIRATVADPSMIDLGCGYVDLPNGFTGIDAYASGDRIRNVDLFVSPWPIADASVDIFTSSHFVEHVPSWDNHFAEVYRCLKPSGVYRFCGPYAKSDRHLQDPDHKQPLTEARLYYLNQQWRSVNRIDHYGARVNFSVQGIGYWWHADYEHKSAEAQQYALLHNWNVANDIFVILRKEEMLP